MSFKAFVAWCNERACDGCWGMGTAISCGNLIRDIKSLPWWRRKRTWQRYEESVVNDIVKPINDAIAEMGLRKAGAF